MESRKLTDKRTQPNTPEDKENETISCEEVFKKLKTSSTLLSKTFNVINLTGGKGENELMKQKLKELTDSYTSILSSLSQLSGKDLSIDSQEKIITEEEKRLKEKKRKVETFRQLPIFKVPLSPSLSTDTDLANMPEGENRVQLSIKTENEGEIKHEEAEGNVAPIQKVKSTGEDNSKNIEKETVIRVKIEDRPNGKPTQEVNDPVTLNSPEKALHDEDSEVIEID